MKPKQIFCWIFGITLFIKGVMAWVLPVTGDEAYYLDWGRHLALGYYDQPPMIGWWLWLMQKFGSHLLWLRLPTVLLAHVIALSAFWAFREAGNDRKLAQSAAFLSLSVFLLHPLHVFPVLMVTDIPLIYFVWFSILGFILAIKKRSLAGMFAVGILLGFGFLSKYFALFLLASFGGYFIFYERTRWALKAMALTCVGILPAALVHLAWNSQNCWINFLFNFGSRHSGDSFGYENLGLFLLYQLYALSPFLIYYGVKHFAQWVKLFKTRVLSVFVLSYLFPFLIFLYTSLKHGQGLHWMLTFTPALFISMTFVFKEAVLKKLLWMMGIFFLVHAAAVGWLFAQNDSFWRQYRFYPNYVLFKHVDKVVEPLRSLGSDVTIATDGYSGASALARVLGRHVSVWGPGSKFGRHDDFVTNWKSLEGKNVTLITRTQPSKDGFDPYFESLTKDEFEVSGVKFYLVKGVGFKFGPYKEAYLNDIAQRYYVKEGWPKAFRCQISAW